MSEQGYKAFQMFVNDSRFLHCRDYLYQNRVGSTYEVDEAILCQKGFHYCAQAKDVFRYYSPLMPNIIVCKVTALGEIKSDSNKACTTKIRIDGIVDGVIDGVHFKDGKLHCDTDEPALQSKGQQFWFKNGLLHRENGPALITFSKAQHWYLNGKRHRENGPAIISGNREEWYLNGERHRKDGPAVLRSSGQNVWYLNGRLHREDGPAIEGFNGTKGFYIDGKLMKVEDEKKEDAKNEDVKKEE